MNFNIGDRVKVVANKEELIEVGIFTELTGKICTVVTVNSIEPTTRVQDDEGYQFWLCTEHLERIGGQMNITWVVRQIGKAMLALIIALSLTFILIEYTVSEVEEIEVFLIGYVVSAIAVQFATLEDK